MSEVEWDKFLANAGAQPLAEIYWWLGFKGATPVMWGYGFIMMSIVCAKECTVLVMGLSRRPLCVPRNALYFAACGRVEWKVLANTTISTVCAAEYTVLRWWMRLS